MTGAPAKQTPLFFVERLDPEGKVWEKIGPDFPDRDSAKRFADANDGVVRRITPRDEA